MLFQSREELMGYDVKELWLFCKYQDVVEVYDHMSVVDHILIDVVHERLESGWGIAKAESHYCGFIKSKGRLEGSFVFISFADSNIVVSPSNIKLGKITGAA